MSAGLVRKGRRGVGIATMLLAVLLLLGTAQAAPPEPYMVKDIRSGAGASDPRDLESAGGLLYFVANDGASAHDDELWRSNGSEGGTILVKDIKPAGPSAPYELTAVGARVFFRADDGTYGRELWVSDGGEAGTRKVKDINPGADSSYPSGLTAVGGHVFFHADDGALGHGREALGKRRDGARYGPGPRY